MRAGRLRHRVAIQAATAGKGTLGGVTRTWSTVATVWAGIEPLKGAERIAADTVQAQLSCRIVLRYSAYPGLTSAHRLRFGSRIFELTGPPVNVGERNVEWQCDCREIV